MKKKTLVLMLMVILCLTGCNKEIQYKTSYIRVHHINEETEIIEVEVENIDNILSILNDGEWNNNATPKTYCNYVFELSGITLYYASGSGVINDKTNKRFIVISKEQRDYINSLINASDNGL